MSEAQGTIAGVTEAVAAPQQTSEKPSSGAQMTDGERDAAFEALIKGEYRASYEKRMQDAIQRRLRGARENAKRISELSPALEALGKRYGVDPAESSALCEAILAGENRQPEAMTEADKAETARTAEGWRQEAEALREYYPGFSLETELGNPTFRALLAVPGMELRGAYEALHMKEILPAAMQYAAKTVEKKLTAKFLTGGVRPPENGSDGQSAALSRMDVAAMTPGQRQEIIRRVQQGERIRF